MKKLDFTQHQRPADVIAEAKRVADERGWNESMRDRFENSLFSLPYFYSEFKAMGENVNQDLIDILKRELGENY